jgi:2-polyprenyl-3-methyl-5-hydroxy-6-metoxy-1,4-benzoquinol methylase
MRNYNEELKDTQDRKYAYSFDLDVMHPYMFESFKSHFVEGNCLELGSSKGDFTKHLTSHFDDIACVEASQEAISISKQKVEVREGSNVMYFNSLFETVELPKKYDNIILTHVLEHIDDPVELLSRIKAEWLSDNGKLFLVCPNANAPSRQIAVKMGLIPNNTAVTPAEAAHGHRITYTLDTLERDARAGGLEISYRSGIFFKALANFQWDKILHTDIVSKEYLDGCYALGQQYPDLCSSIMLICKK